VVSEYLAEIGCRGGLKDGKTRTGKFPAKRKAEIARKVAKAIWKNLG